jgi:uncharacterized protein (DUF1697 family)
VHTFIALLRGINVVGRNMLPMKELAAILEDAGARNARTYLHSGNAVFRSSARDRARLSKKLSAEIRKRRGFEPRILILARDEIERAIAQNPFPEAEADPAHLHLGFLASVPENPDLDKLERLRRKSERFRLIDSVFYLHAPDGIGRSKLAAASEKVLGVTMTDRNWRTVCKIRDLATQ